MNTLDNRTLLLIAGVLYVLLPLAVWLVLRWPRQSAPRTWAAGGVVGGIGLLFIGLRGQLPDLVSYAMGHPMLALGATLVAQSLRMDLGRPWPWHWLGLGTLAYAGTLAWLLPWAETHVLGTLIRSINLGVLMLLIVSAWQVGRYEESRNAKTIALVYGFQAVGVTANLVNALLGGDNIRTLEGQKVNVTVSLVTLVVALSASLSYLGLALERLRKKQMRLAGEEARARQWQARREALVLFDRERLMTMLSDSLGHAMAQPLTAALIRVQVAQRLLRSPEPDPRTLAETLEHVEGQLHRTSETVEQVRQWVRPPEIQPARLDLTRLLDELRRLLRQEIINRGIDMQWRWPDTPVWVHGDHLQLSQAVVQLLRNALEAVHPVGQNTPASRPQKPQIRVALVTTEDRVKLIVQDNGPGLPAQWLSDQNDQAAAPPTRLQGIGLFVVQSIVQQHRGQLVMANSARGGGHVTLALPLHSPIPA